MTTTESSTAETATDRVARLGGTDITPSRMESLEIAHAAGVSDMVFAALCAAVRVSCRPTIVIPAHRYEGLSRGKGWARKGRGSTVEWGERESGGYRVGPGWWTVGGSDGFARKGQDTWTVEHVQVGGETWTTAY